MNVPYRLYLFILILLLSSSCLTDYCKQGETLMAGQKYDEAITCFDKVLSSEENNIKALNGKGQCLVNLEKYDQAIDCFNKALSLDPNNADIWLNKGGALYEKYYYELNKSDKNEFITFDPLTGTGILNDHREMGTKEKEIKACLDKVLEIEANPDDMDGLYRKGLAFYYRGDYDEALQCFDEIILYVEIDSQAIKIIETKMSDENTKKLKTLMNKKFSRKDFFENLKKLALSEQDIYVVFPFIVKVKSEKKYEKAIYFSGCSLFYMKEYDSAMEDLNLVLDINPGNIDVFIMKSQVLSGNGENDKAVECLDEALKVKPRSYALLINKAFILYNMKKYEEAIKSIDKALELKTDVYALTLKGNCLCKSDKYEEAITFYDKALNINSGYIDAFAGKSYALYLSGKYDEALKWLNKVLEIDPKNVSALGEKGRILLKKKDYKGSLDCYDRVLAIDSNYSDVYLYKAKALTGMGHYRKALKCYDTALKIDPSYKEAKKEREKFIKDYYIIQNILEANEMVKKGYAGLRGYVYTSDKTEEAMKCFDRALDLDPENTDAWVGKAET
ncbi:MAG: tetratricopeptide repeat protein, partial [Candidatus Eremiobacterota bacterium]